MGGKVSGLGPIIAVLGGAHPTPEEFALAEAVGRALAENGAVVVCGGMGGVMEAACRGAKAGGGTTVGILSGTDVGEANPYVDIPIVTGIGVARNVIILRTAQAAVAVGGSYGTLSELAYALTFGVSVVGVGTWRMERDGHPDPPIHREDDPQAAAVLALKLAAEKVTAKRSWTVGMKNDKGGRL